MSSSRLPEPSVEALAVSRELARRIDEAIDAGGGWIGFDRYMQFLLYEPGLGYYAGGSRKFGREGDFITAPEMSPLFGRCVARQCREFLEQAPGSIVEFGAGSGALAAQVLESLHAERAAPARYCIVELSGELRERQRSTLEQRVPALLERVEWLDALPQRIEGVVLANEVLDAMPVRLFRWTAGAVCERGVARAKGGSGRTGDRDVPDSAYRADRTDFARFEYADRPADPDFAFRVRSLLADAWSGSDEAPQDYVSEVGEQAQAWVETVGARLARGALLLLDYGFPRREFYHPQRNGGTLQCHYRHRVHGDPFVWPGLQDVTAHVDFSAVHDAALRAGLAPLGYNSQARFLLDCGLLEAFDALASDDARTRVRQAQAVQQLLSEAEMGELFKAIAFGRDVPDRASGFSTRDRRDVLQ